MNSEICHDGQDIFTILIDLNYSIEEPHVLLYYYHHITKKTLLSFSEFENNGENIKFYSMDKLQYSTPQNLITRFVVNQIVHERALCQTVRANLARHQTGVDFR